MAEYIRVLLSQYEGKIVFPVNYSNGGKLKWAKISEFLSFVRVKQQRIRRATLKNTANHKAEPRENLP